MNPWQEHLEGMKEYEAELGCGDPLGMATLSFMTVPGNPTVPTTHTRIVTDFELMNGLSAKTFVELCEFETALLPIVPTKGLKCLLTINKGGATYPMQLWHGGPQPGGYIQRWMLVDSAYKG
jgi:hypothetical protein